MTFASAKSSSPRPGTLSRWLGTPGSSERVLLTTQSCEHLPRTSSTLTFFRLESETTQLRRRSDFSVSSAPFAQCDLCLTPRPTAHSGTPHAQTLITALFNQSAEDRIRKDFSYDFYDGQGVSPPLSLSVPPLTSSCQAKVDNDPYGEIVRDKLQQVFRRKGAVCMDSPLLMPYSSIYAARNPVRLLDADGTIACLPFQLNIPFCEYEFLGARNSD